VKNMGCYIWYQSSSSSRWPKGSEFIVYILFKFGLEK